MHLGRADIANMAPELRSILPALTASGLLFAPASGMGESARAGQGHASAALELRVIIPPVMRVLENTHPPQLQAEANGDWSGRQRLVVMSNMKHGFCVTLRLNSPEVNDWRLRAVQGDHITLDPLNGGYRLCAARAGQYTLLLDHAFVATDQTRDAATGALSWPVQTYITAL